MSHFFKNNKLIVLFCALIIFIALIGLSIRSHSQSIPEQYAGDSISFGQRVFSYPMQVISATTKAIFHNEAQPSQSENQLKSDNQRLQAENKQLRDDLKISDISKYDPMAVNVIARHPDQWMNTLIIDKGAKSGITENMAVLTPNGLIGRVTKVNQFSAQVNLISTKGRTNRLSVHILNKDKEAFGLIDHYDEKSDRLIISDIDNSHKLSKGDKVITSGLGDQLPRGIFVGEVEKVQNDQYGLSKQVVVKTGANINQIGTVYVAKRDPKTVDRSEEDAS
ncbi:MULTISPECIES: rod shape-determining protein MreC [Staphylococcus]|uniref:Cell shape-determining protein MreC n=1 Tax=Staphylococcus agnetis TaxID=985762 RepID=A0A242VF81_9STAP|nr:MULTISPECIES: rod shape-determining protein MreC [Staphylococcus]ALN76610.1 rod shape-determining protein MreC [Staphylococcus agnetis]MBY7663724.1 rod shape-determining protein MreC [Staphylococcus agnetis]MCO4337660.1 rod shape-determining protein MreC [Staphylococcus agnetis]MCO4340931.1 rod shape-determining protein MreC [Staphylococcus agnetis]MCO4342636.1 rod shape-determining protein MreC [Staphylococcus agnetis]